MEDKTTRWLKFTMVLDTGNTKRFDVMGKSSNRVLGQIGWQPRLMRYVFMPMSRQLFDHEALDDISAFLKELYEDRKGKILQKQMKK